MSYSKMSFSLTNYTKAARRWVPAGAVIGMLMFASAPRAEASIMFYDIFKTQNFGQTSNSSPTTAVGYNGFANINASLASDLSGGTVSSSSPLSPMTLAGSGGNYGYGAAFATKAALDTAFPNGTTFTYHVTGGTYNGQSATLTTPASDAYSATIPYFTGSTYTTLQNFNSANSISLTFNSFGATGAANVPLTFISINQVSDGHTVYSQSGSNALTSAMVAGNTFLPGTQYDLSIVYSDRVSINNAGFGTATAFTAYDLRTDLLFTTASALAPAPEPASFALAGLGAALTLLFGARRARNRDALVTR